MGQIVKCDDLQSDIPSVLKNPPMCYGSMHEETITSQAAISCACVYVTGPSSAAYVKAHSLAFQTMPCAAT